MTEAHREIIIVRSLTESDLGLFAAHRAAASSKQRPININAGIARRLLSADLYDQGQADLKCTCTFDGFTVQAVRRLGKSHKNWRLGGRKIEGAAFSELDSKDFALIRSVAENDGTQPVTITFISRATDRVVHAGLAAIVQRHLDPSMAAFEDGAEGFTALAAYCPVLPWEAGTPAQGSSMPAPAPPIPPMPIEDGERHATRPRTIKEKIHAPHILERMLKVAGDLSAPAQLRFMETVEQLASQLRYILLETGGIIRIERDHTALWEGVAGRPIGFVDGGDANLSMLGSAPTAARVGGYTVTPGARGLRSRHVLRDNLFG